MALHNIAFSKDNQTNHNFAKQPFIAGLSSRFAINPEQEYLELGTACVRSIDMSTEQKRCFQVIVFSSSFLRCKMNIRKGAIIAQWICMHLSTILAVQGSDPNHPMYAY